MGMNIVTEFIAKETVRVKAYIYDDNDDLVNPTTSTKVTIKDPDGTTQVDGEDMTEDETGIYDYYYNTTTETAKGWWTGEVVTIDGSGDSAKTTASPFAFRIK